MYIVRVYFVPFVQDHFTALHHACRERHRDIVSLLLTCGADVHALTKVCHMFSNHYRFLQLPVILITPQVARKRDDK